MSHNAIIPHLWNAFVIHVLDCGLLLEHVTNLLTRERKLDRVILRLWPN